MMEFVGFLLIFMLAGAIFLVVMFPGEHRDETIEQACINKKKDTKQCKK